MFGDRDSGAYLPKLAWTGIARHVMVKGGASPDDPDLAEYWANRRRKVQPPLDEYTLRLLSKQDGVARCAGTPYCPPTSRLNPRVNGNGGGYTSPAGR